MHSIEEIINKNINNVKADFRISCRYLKNSKVIYDYMLNPEIKCHMASVVKLWALIASLYEAQNSRLDLSTTYRLEENDIIEGQFILGNLHSGIELTLYDLIRLMIVGYDTFSYDIVFNKFLKNQLANFIKNIFKFRNTDISFNILDLNLKLSGIYELSDNRNVKWGNVFDFMEECEESIENTNDDKSPEIDINDYNYTNIGDMTELLTKLINLEILNEKYFSIAEDILLSQYDATRIPAKVPADLTSSVGHQIGTITDGESYQIINDCGFIKLDDNEYLILNFFCCNIQEERHVINNTIATIARDIINFIKEN